MRIGWFTPLHRQSAIGSFSAAVCAVLAQQHTVTIYAGDLWHHDESWPIDPPVVLLREADDRAVLDELEACDAVFYNMGDHLRNHKRVYEWLQRRPGIVILHDLVLRSFFVGYYMTDGRFDRLGLLDLVESCHGWPGREWFRKWQEGEIPTWTTDPRSLDYHVANAVTRHATGVVVHSRFAQKRAGARGGPPVRHVPFPTPPLAPVALHWPYPPSNQATGRINALTFGCINQNKMVDAVIETISRSERLRQSLNYTIVGRISDPAYEKRLRRLIRGCGLDDAVRMLGPVDDQTLHHQLRQADVVVNLRNPHLGESSWSLLESLFAGKPTIVWDHGYYGEFPEDVVLKVASRDDLMRGLERLCRQPDRRRRLSARARAYAVRNFSIDDYCRALVALARPGWARWLPRLRHWFRAAG
jgi:glycosyltransferase involved in cell wall biosynthesis